MMAERGMRVDHPTFHRWAVLFLPLLLKRFTRRKRMVTLQEMNPMMGRTSEVHLHSGPIVRRAARKSLAA